MHGATRRMAIISRRASGSTTCCGAAWPKAMPESPGRPAISLRSAGTVIAGDHPRYGPPPSPWSNTQMGGWGATRPRETGWTQCISGSHGETYNCAGRRYRKLDTVPEGVPTKRLVPKVLAGEKSRHMSEGRQASMETSLPPARVPRVHLRPRLTAETAKQVWGLHGRPGPAGTNGLFRHPSRSAAASGTHCLPPPAVYGLNAGRRGADPHRICRPAWGRALTLPVTTPQLVPAFCPASGRRAAPAPPLPSMPALPGVHSTVMNVAKASPPTSPLTAASRTGPKAPRRTESRSMKSTRHATPIGISPAIRLSPPSTAPDGTLRTGAEGSVVRRDALIAVLVIGADQNDDVVNQISRSAPRFAIRS